MRDCPRPARPDPAAGFTLFELLIVILIIGVMLTFAVLSIGSRAGFRPALAAIAGACRGGSGVARCRSRIPLHR